jgi:Ca2+-transporting ATPase
LTTREREGRLETVIPFGPERKRSLVAYRQTVNSEDYIRVVVKGAPEYVLPMCGSYLRADGASVGFFASDA